MQIKKKTISSGSETFEKILKTNLHFKKFFLNFSNNNNLYSLYFRLLPYFIYSRKNKIIDVIKLLRFPRFHFKEFKKNIFFNDVSVGFQISYIENGGKIVPHTDSISKLLSLMVYFPDNSEENEEDFGTVFYRYNKVNYNNKHLEDEEDLIDFKRNAKIIYKSPFQSINKIYGFIKTDKSWHSVDEINASSNYLRKSININFNLA